MKGIEQIQRDEAELADRKRSSTTQTKENHVTKKNETKSDKTNGAIAVLVTTTHRGVFFGYADPKDIERIATTKSIRLTNARNCLMWSSAMGGFLGLANVGPDSNCKIGPRANTTLLDVTSVAEASPAAVDRWEGANTSWR